MGRNSNKIPWTIIEYVLYRIKQWMLSIGTSKNYHKKGIHFHWIALCWKVMRNEIREMQIGLSDKLIVCQKHFARIFCYTFKKPSKETERKRIKKGKPMPFLYEHRISIHYSSIWILRTVFEKKRTERTRLAFFFLLVTCLFSRAFN